MLHRKRIIKKGPAMHFVAAPTREHAPILSMPELAEHAVRQLARATSEANAAVAGYVALPSSVMALVAFRGDYDLAGFMYDFKRLSALDMIALEHGEFHERLYRKGKFRPWMGRFDQMKISSYEQFQARLDYMHNEPVRRGLVSRPLDWPFSSARDWLAKNRGMIEITKDLSCVGLS